MVRRAMCCVVVIVSSCGAGGVLPDDPDAGPVMADVDASVPLDGGVDLDGGCVFPPVTPVSFSQGASGPTSYFLSSHPAPRGLIVALHGTNGSSISVAQNKLEWQAFFREAVARGYSVLVPESEQRTSPRRWDNSPTATNPDIVRIAGLLDVARRQGALPMGQPIFFIGMSQGGGVAPIFAQVLASRGEPVRAVAVHSAGGTAVYSNAAYRLPTTFVAMANDTLVPAAETVASAQLLAGRGIASSSFVQPGTRVCPERFTRIPGLDATASRSIFAGLVTAGALAADGTVLAGGTDQDQSSALAGVPPAYAASTRAIDEQLQVAGASHAFFGGRAANTLDFFEMHR